MVLKFHQEKCTYFYVHMHVCTCLLYLKVLHVWILHAMVQLRVYPRRLCTDSTICTICTFRTLCLYKQYCQYYMYCLYVPYRLSVQIVLPVHILYLYLFPVVRTMRRNAVQMAQNASMTHIQTCRLTLPKKLFLFLSTLSKEQSVSRVEQKSHGNIHKKHKCISMLYISVHCNS